jgi:sulfur transfer protein SufE
METPELPQTEPVEPDTQAPLDAVAAAAGEPEAPKLNDEQVIAALASLPAIEYDRLRRETAKAMGIQVKTLDDLVRASRNENAEPENLFFVEVEPHPDPVDLAEVLDEVANIIRRYVVLDQVQADAVALWIAMTWIIDVVEVAPIAIITAPEKACGKSHLLEVISHFVYRPLSAASSSASFLFRAIELWQPTILIDEADTFIKDNDELKGLVNAGHTRANAYVGRTVAVGDGHEPRLFRVWGAKAFAGISLEKQLPDATMSRGIVLTLRRKLAHETVSRLRHADRDSFTALAAKLARFAEDYSAQVRSARPGLPEELSDRAQDNWEPLLAIAGCAGQAWIERATKAALKLSGASDNSTSAGNQLLADIKHIFDGNQSTKISTVDLISALVWDEEKSWATYNRGKPLSPRQLAKLLAGYEIKSKTVRLSQSATPKGYELAQFEDAFARYLPAPGGLMQQRNGDANANGDIDLGDADRGGPAATGSASATHKPLSDHGMTSRKVS